MIVIPFKPLYTTINVTKILCEVVSYKVKLAVLQLKVQKWKNIPEETGNYAN